MSDNLSLKALLASYKQWVASNPQKASEFETTAKWISYFIAGRVNNSNLLSELIYTLSNLLVFFNDYTISQNRKLKKPKTEDKIKLWLSILEYSEVFIEISFKKLWGEKGKWIIIVILQITKAIGRLMLILNYKQRITHCPPIKPLERFNLNETDGNDSKQNSLSYIPSIGFKLKRSGRIIRTVESAPPISYRQWKPPVMQNDLKQKKSENSIKPLKGVLLKAEIIYILKPLIHLLALYKSGNKTWKPWIIALILDICSLFIYKTKERDELSEEQRLELSRRTVALLLYILRSPFYDNYSKNKIDAFLHSLGKNIPLVGMISSPLAHYIPIWQETYFYTWSN